MEQDKERLDRRLLLIPVIVYAALTALILATGWHKLPGKGSPAGTDRPAAHAALWMLLLLLGCGGTAPTTTPVVSDAPVDGFPALADGEVAVLFGGDMLLADGVKAHLDKDGLDWPFRNLQATLGSARAVAFVANQEGPVTGVTEKGQPRGKWMYRQHPKTLTAYKQAGITHLSVANNHALDRTMQGMLDTLEHSRKAGITPFAGGRNAAEAAAPALIDAGGVRVAVVGGIQPWTRLVKAGWGATADGPGIHVFDDDGIRDALAAARAQADVVIAYPHWGSNYAPVDGDQRKIAQAMLKAGADAVIGHHGHGAQGFALIDGRPVVYGLGNAFFGTPGRFGYDKMQPGYGLLARLVIDVAGRRIARVELLPFTLNNRLVDYQPRPIPQTEAVAQLSALATAEGAKVPLDGGIAVLTAR